MRARAILILCLMTAGCGRRSEFEAPVAGPTALAAIPGGKYRPMYPGKDELEPIAVAPFMLEVHAVTNAQFREFVSADPRWRRSQLKSLYASEGYLSHWSGDLEFDPAIDHQPVRNISWFAARAYAKWCGRRLPTLAEWELAAAGKGAEGRASPEVNQRILDWYSRPTPEQIGEVMSTPDNGFGVHDLHGLVWEWVEDFNTAMVTGESRGDSGLERDLFCGSGSIGAADPSDYAAFMRFAFRSSLKADYVGRGLGFRCAVDGDHSAPSCCRELAPEAPAAPKDSIYQLDATWQDQSGASRTLHEFAGEPVLLAMIFTNCTFACPRILVDVAAIESALAPEELAQTRTLLVSFDSARDTPAVLAAYATKQGLDTKRTTLLHGAAHDVRELAAVLGIAYQQTATGDFAHSSLITLLDRDGRIVFQQKGLSADASATLAALRSLYIATPVQQQSF